MCDKPPKRRTVRQQNREVVESEQPAPWNGTGAGALLQLEDGVAISRRRERREPVESLPDYQAEDLLVVADRPVEVAHLEPDPPDASATGKPVSRRRDAKHISHLISRYERCPRFPFIPSTEKAPGPPTANASEETRSISTNSIPFGTKNPEWKKKIAPAMSSASGIAISLVNIPAANASPPASSRVETRIAAMPGSGMPSPEKKPVTPSVPIMKNFWYPCAANTSPVTMRRIPRPISICR